MTRALQNGNIIIINLGDDVIMGTNSMYQRNNIKQLNLIRREIAQSTPKQSARMKYARYILYQ